MMEELEYRKANKKDVEWIVQLLAADPMGRKREEYADPLPEAYYKAFDRIEADPNQELMVLLVKDEIIGTFQLSFLPYLTYKGGIRCQVEGVRIKGSYRGKGVGSQMFRWIIQRAKDRRAHVLQLTTDKQRPEALDFYRKLGFGNSHEGLKLHLYS